MKGVRSDVDRPPRCVTVAGPDSRPGELLGVCHRCARSQKGCSFRMREASAWGKTHVSEEARWDEAAQAFQLVGEDPPLERASTIEAFMTRKSTTPLFLPDPDEVEAEVERKAEEKEKAKDKASGKAKEKRAEKTKEKAGEKEKGRKKGERKEKGKGKEKEEKEEEDGGEDEEEEKLPATVAEWLKCDAVTALSDRERERPPTRMIDVLAAMSKEKKKETEKAMEELEAAFAKARKLQDEWGLLKGLMGYWEEKGDWDTRKVESVMSELERKSKK